MYKLISKPLTMVLSFLMVFSTFMPVYGAMSSSDYETHWAKETIQSAIASGVIEGYLDGSVKPDSSITRAEFFKIVNNTFKFSGMSESTYTDVESGAWYAPVIAKAKAAGYIIAYTDGSIRPNNNISRQEAAVIFSRLKSLTATSNTLSYTDASSIANWSKEAIIAAFEANIMIGYPDGSFKPEALLTRAEALVSITKVFNYQVVVPVSDISVTQETMTLIAGGEAGIINATITPANATNQNITWISSDTNVVTVDGGVVTPISVGTATITITSEADTTIIAVIAVTVIIDGLVEKPIVQEPTTVDPVNLGMAADYVILSKTGISSVPDSVIIGNIGVSPIDSTGITGFSLTMDASNEFSISSQITGKVYASDYATPTPSNLITAISNMETAYTDAAGRSADFTELYSGDISGKTLTAGVYKWGTGVLINGDVTLNGGANDVWIFQISGGITQSNGTRIILTGGAQAKNIFWQSAETVSIGSDAHSEGIIMSMTNITMGTNSSIKGRLLAQTAVTLDKSTVVAP